MRGYGQIYALLAAGMLALAIVAIACKDARDYKKRHGAWPTFSEWIGIDDESMKPKRPN